MEFKKVIKSENPNNEILSSKEIFKTKGKQLQRWIEIEKETGKELLIINEAKAMEAIIVREAQIEYKFYKKWWKKIYNGEETGAELLIKAESKFKELCKMPC